MEQSIKHIARFAAREGVSLEQLLAGLQPMHFAIARREYLAEIGRSQ